jgi:hypothetical protein
MSAKVDAVMTELELGVKTIQFTLYALNVSDAERAEIRDHLAPAVTAMRRAVKLLDALARPTY